MSIARFRWIIAALLLISTALNYTDRVTLSVLAGRLRQDLSFTETEYGQIVSVFLFSYAIMYAGSGYVVDRLGTRRGFAVFSFAWSLAQCLHGLVIGKWSLALCRSLLGLSEPGNFPAAVKAVGEWFPADQRALGVGIFNAGSSLGMAIASPLTAWLALRYSWRLAFIATGGMGFVWLFFWLLIYQSPEKNRWISLRERMAATTAAGRTATDVKRPPWWHTLRSRGCLTLMLVRCLSDPVIYFVIFWLPAYLEKARGFDLVMIGRYGWVPFIFGDLGYIAGGWLSGSLIKRGWALPKARKAAMILGACLLPAAIAAPLVPSARSAIAAMSVVVFGHAVWISNLLTLPTDLFAENAVATVTGFSGLAGSFGGILGNLATGYVVTHFSYIPVFVVAGLMHPISVGLVLILLPSRLFCENSRTIANAQ